VGQREALLFPPDMEVYFQVMGTLRAHTATTAAWIPPAMRQLRGGARIRGLAANWRAYFGEGDGATDAPDEEAGN
jgi:hypothetical protein